MKSELINEFDTALRLWNDQDDLIAAVLKGPKRKVFELAETLSAITRYHSVSNKPANENFSFTANASLSGGRHPCAAPKCRMEKIDSLISFATLYADEVYIQNPFENISLESHKELHEANRNEILNGLFAYMQFRPLMERGLIKYALNTAPFCDHHFEHVAKPLLDRIHEKEAALEAAIHNELIECCAVTFNFENVNSPFFQITGPDSLIEHGSVYLHAYTPPPKIFNQFRRKGPIYKLSRAEIEDSGALRYVIDPIVRDLAMQEWHTALCNTSYLCDNKAHIRLASKINPENFIANSTAFEKGLQHHLPSIFSNDVHALLSLREQEEEAFLVYRDNLRKLLQKTDGWDENEVSRVFRDEILPEVNLIKKRVNDWKSNTRQSIGEKIIFGAGAVTLGLYAGVLPANVGQIVAALGGGSAIASALMDFNKTFKEKQQARTNDFYFLWQATKTK